jgi:hypothetical protein
MFDSKMIIGNSGESNTKFEAKPRLGDKRPDATHVSEKIAAPLCKIRLIIELTSLEVLAYTLREFHGRCQRNSESRLPPASGLQWREPI